MDNLLYHRLVDHVRVAAKAIGVDPGDVSAAKGTVALVGTGVEIWWLSAALGVGRPGWQVRETYHSIDLIAQTDRTKTDIVGNFAPDDVYGAAKSAALRAITHRIEAALGTVPAY
jgi:hypothetical protein